MQQANLVSVVLVNWNGQKYIGRCLDSLRAQTWSPSEIILVDNASTDGSLGLARAVRDLDIHFIQNHENLGFARANNQGITASSGEFVLLLNVDAELEPHYIEHTVSALQQDKRLGSATGKLYRLKDGLRTRHLDTTGLLLLTSRYPLDRGQGSLDEGQFDDSQRIFGACAAAALFRRKTLEDVAFEGEYFDESFLMYFEDVDLAWRSLLYGWECAFVPSAVGWHARSGSGGIRQRHIDVHLLKNRYLFMLKNDRVADVIWHIGPISLFNAIDLVKIARWPYLSKALIKAAKALPRTLQWRRIIQANRRVPRDIPRRYFVSSKGLTALRWQAYRSTWR